MNEINQVKSISWALVSVWSNQQQYVFANDKQLQNATFSKNKASFNKIQLNKKSEERKFEDFPNPI